MFRHLTIICCLLMATLLFAQVQEPDKEYVRIYRMIQEADLLKQSGQERPAIEKFREAKSALERLQTTNPDWYGKVVQFRLNYVNDRLRQMTALVELAKPAIEPAPKTGTQSVTEEQLATLVAEITRLRAEKTVLEGKVRDAQSSASTLTGRDAAKADEKVRALQRENELLKADLDQQQARLTKMADPVKLEELQKNLAEANRKLGEQTNAVATLGSLLTVNEQLKKQLADSSQQQQSQAQSLTQAQKQVEQLKTDAAALETRLQAAFSPTNRAALAAAENQAVELTKLLTQTRSDLEKQKALAQALATDKSQQTEKAAQAQKQADQLKAEAAALEARLQTALSPTNRAALTDAENRAAALTKELKQIKADLDAKDARAKALETDKNAQAEKFKKDMAELETRLQAALSPTNRATLMAAEEKAAALAKELQQAKADLSAKDAQAKALEADKAGQTEKISQAQKELTRLQTEKAALDAQLKQALAQGGKMVDRQQLTKSEEAVRNLQKDNEQLKKSIKDQESRLNTMVERAQLEAVQKSLDESTRKLAEQTQTIITLGSLQTANDNLKKQLAGTKRETESRARAEARAESLAKDLKQAQADLSKQQSLVKNLESEKEQMADKSAQNQKEIDRLKSDKAVLEARLKEMKAPVFPDAQELARAEERSKSLQKENDALRADIKQQQARLNKAVDPAHLETAQKSLSEANRKLADQSRALAQLNSVQSANDNLKKQLAELKSKRDTRAKADAMDQELKIARAEIATQLTAIKTLKAEKASLADELLKADVQRLAAGDKGAATRQSQQLARIEQQVKSLQNENARLKAERVSLAEELFKVDVALLHSRDEGRQLGDRVKTLEQTSSELQKKLDQVSQRQSGFGKSAPRATGRNDLEAQWTALRARVEILEAKPVPFTAEELKLLSRPAPGEAVQSARSARKTSRDFLSEQWPEVGDAERAFADGRYADAERKYQSALKRDKDNVFLLANLASVQLEQLRLKEAEATLDHALAVDADDPASLTLLGVLRLHQKRFDDALSILSTVAKQDPSNASTQNYLGVALSEKGLRGPAEAALRKAVELQPGNPVAHNNLAVVYATQKPPFLELARWHYQKALAGGHRRNSLLEQLLNGK